MAQGSSLLLSIVVSGLFAAAPQEESGARARDEASEILERGGYQRSLPGNERASPETPPAPVEPEKEPDPPPSDERRDGPVRESVEPPDVAAETAVEQSGGSTAKFVSVLLALGVAAIAVVMLLRRRAALAAAEPRNAKAQPQAIEKAGAIADPDAPELLAGAGRFDEAVHQVLLRLMRELVRRLALELRHGSTSREFATAVPMTAPRGAVSELVHLVERSRFAEQRLTANDYARSVELARVAAPADEETS